MGVLDLVQIVSGLVGSAAGIVGAVVAVVQLRSTRSDAQPARGTPSTLKDHPPPQTPPAGSRWDPDASMGRELRITARTAMFNGLLSCPLALSGIGLLAPMVRAHVMGTRTILGFLVFGVGAVFAVVGFFTALSVPVRALTYAYFQVGFVAVLALIANGAALVAVISWTVGLSHLPS